jgi:N6-adenosine-specific RNA methylase IME4
LKVDIFRTDKKYGVIYADPAWTYRDKALAGNRGAGCKYPVMSLEDICRLPVKDLAADDCVLFLWVTMPKLNEAFDVMKAWGFEYKTCAFTWVKQNRKSDRLFWGMGRWTRANAELCLLGTKGKPKREDAGGHSVIISHVEEHSKKPAETRDRIVRLLGAGGGIQKIELFARQTVEGWDCWGNEV